MAARANPAEYPCGICGMPIATSAAQAQQAQFAVEVALISLTAPSLQSKGKNNSQISGLHYSPLFVP
jgi:hypothetical protein